MSDSLQRLARRVEADPLFLASLLAEYARAERLDDAQLAQALGCHPEDLTALRLCRAPRADPVGFREDVRLIAARFGLDEARLMQIVRQGQALTSLRQGAPAAPGFLMAAREKPKEPPAAEGKDP